MLSKYNLSLDSNSTYRWRTKLTAGKRDRTRLCASSNGKSKSIKAQGHAAFSRPLHPRTRPSRNVGGACGGTRGGRAKQRSVFEESHHAPHEVPTYGTVRY